MTAMSTGGTKDGHKGWRLALRHALGDVAQSDLLHPNVRQVRAREAESLSLLDLLDETDGGR